MKKKVVAALFLILFFSLSANALFASGAKESNKAAASTAEIEAINNTQNNDSQALQTDATQPSQTETAQTQTKENSLNIEDATAAQTNNLNIIYKGEHHLNVGVGLMVPMFMHFYNDKTIGPNGNGVVNATHHYNPAVGLNGFFNYRFFFDGGWALGAVLGGSYINTSQNSQTLIHLGVEGTYMFRRWPFDIPISFELGAHFNALQLPYPAENIRSGGIFFKPQIGFYYNINDNWAIGCSTEYWIVPEIILNENKAQSNFTHIWGFTVNVRYRFD